MRISRRHRFALMQRRALLAAASPGFAPAGRDAADRIKVGMLKPNIVTVIYWIAVKTRAFQKNGLDVVENPFPSGQTAAGIEQLMRGGIDFYLGASGEVAHANSRYVEAGKPPPIALIEGGVAGGSFFVLRDDLNGKTLDELRGQNLRIGISNPSSYHLILLRAFLRERGHDHRRFRLAVPDRRRAGNAARHGEPSVGRFHA